MSVFDQGIWYADLDYLTWRWCSTSYMMIYNAYFTKRKKNFYFYIKCMMYWLYKWKQLIKAERLVKRGLCLYQVKWRCNDSQRQWGGWRKQIPIKVSLIPKRLLFQLFRLLVLSGISHYYSFLIAISIILTIIGF